MYTYLWLISGLLLGFGLIKYARLYRAKGEKKLLSNALVIAAIIYVLFAVVWGDTTWLFIELLGVVIFALFAWAALRYSAYWLSIGWLLHPLWDVALHLSGPGNTVAPAWYAVACIPFDILIAVYVLTRISYWTMHIEGDTKS